MGVDGLFVGFCLHLGAHFSLVKNKVDRLSGLLQDSAVNGTRSGAVGTPPARNDSIRKRIIQIVDDHVAIINLTKQISDSFKFIVFVHFVTASLVIGMTSINFLLVITFVDYFRIYLQKTNFASHFLRQIQWQNCST